jgi:DNA-directed RNA polymerase specialized sigma24 family protein
MANNNIENENKERLDVLYKKHHKWLLAVAINITGNTDIANELIGDLYLYLLEKRNPALWYEDSFNLMYLRSFLQSRYYNRLKSDKRLTEFGSKNDDVDDEYDVEYDQLLETTYDNLVEELKRLEGTKMWASSKLAQLYFYDSEMTLDKLAKQIKISKSTAFLNIRKIKQHLKGNLNNPFNNI